jgi:alpha,alpha-trehalase
MHATVPDRTINIDPERIDAVVFDMDGVLTNTAVIHERAWARTFDAFLERRGEPIRPFGHEDYRRFVDGKPRLDGVRDFLGSRGIKLTEGNADDPPGAATVHGLGRQKNEAFRAALEAGNVESFVDAVDFLDRLAEAGIRVAAVSSSRNAEAVLAAAGIRGRFPVLVDGVVSTARGIAGKPAPDIFLAAARDLGVAPDRTAVAEDATAGVEAARRGGFTLVLGIARNGDPAALRAAGADAVVASFAAVKIARKAVSIEGEYRMRDRHDLPDAFEVILELEEESAPDGPAVCIFLDYDGTLTPIVERPEDAVLDPRMRERLRRVAARYRTAVISGRGLEDLVERVGVPDIFYAASHGFELRHPGGEELSNEAAERAAEGLDDLAAMLERKLADTPGTQLERKRFGLAVHYRRAASGAEATVERAVQEAAATFPSLTLKTGKKVFEFVPDLEWDKGEALKWILETAGLGPDTAYPIFIGDDVTDEDAFRAIDDWGCGIAVGEDGPADTFAYFKLDDVEAVGRFLEALARVR